MNHLLIPIQLEGAHLPQKNFEEFPIHLGEWIDSGKRRDWQDPTISLLKPWIHSDKTRKKHAVVLITPFLKKTIPLETQSRCGMLDKIVKSAWSRIAILADKFICNHNLRHGSKRLHWSGDFSERRSSNFSKGSQHQGQHPRSRWKVIGEHSSSNNNSSRSSPFSKMTFQASGNSVLPGKAEQECEKIRNTPRK